MLFTVECTPNPTEAALRNGHPIEILIVDDSRVQAKVLKDLLQSNAYKVHAAYNGQQALELAREHKPALIISDIVMPVMDGYEMCRCLKQDDELNDIPVILLTSLSDKEDILLGLCAQADYYLTKPFNTEYLLTMITTVLCNPLHAQPDDGEHIEVVVGEAKHSVTANRVQMLSLLFSTYGNAVERNRELDRAKQELLALNEQLFEQKQRIEEQQEKLQEANKRLEALATQDGLTGLKNHRAFKEKLDEEINRALRYGKPLSLILLDVDNFKQYNDAFGHPAGDEILKRVGALLNEHSRASDLVARYGGEEFAILLPNTDRTVVVATAERLRTIIEQESWPLRAVTASFGSSTFCGTDCGSNDRGKMEAAALIESADQALYRSKASGRNRISHALEME